MTDHRRNSVYVAAGCYAISIIFLLLVIIGNTSDKAGLRDLFFFRIDVSSPPLRSPSVRPCSNPGTAREYHTR